MTSFSLTSITHIRWRFFLSTITRNLDLNPLRGAAQPSPSLLQLIKQFWIINQISIRYSFRTPLRPRLTQGGRTFPWKPWVFDGWDSHPSSRYLHRHSHFYIVQESFRSLFFPYGTLPYQLCYSHNSAASVVCFSPGTFSAQSHSTSELLRTLLMMAASEPTSQLFMHLYILLHLAYILGPYLAVWTVFLSTMNFLAHKSDCLSYLLTFGV